MIGLRFSRTVSRLNRTRLVTLKLDEMVLIVIVC
jgi:hypothetical protein